MKVALALLAIILSGFGVYAAQVPDGTRVENVRIDGNKRVPSDSIKYRIQTKPGGLLNMNVVRRDVKELYAQNLFDDIRVDAREGFEKTGLTEIGEGRSAGETREVGHCDGASMTSMGRLPTKRRKRREAKGRPRL